MNRPRYQSIHHELADRIGTGVYPDGGALPSVNMLCAEYRTSRITVNKALELLRQEGLIVCRAGRPARVTGRQPVSKHYRIAILQDCPWREAMYSYDAGPVSWLTQQYLLERLLREQCPALNLSLRFDWDRHLSGVDGVIVANAREVPEKRLRELALPFMALPVDASETIRDNAVCWQYRNALMQTATYFLSGGVRKLVGVLFQPTQFADSGFAEICREYGFAESDLVRVAVENFSDKINDGLAAVLAELRTAGPIGVIAQGDLLAREAVAAARRLNLKFKRDIFIVGLSGLPESSAGDPPLTVIETPYQAAAEFAVDKLYEQIQSGVTTVPGRGFPARLVIRHT